MANQTDALRERSGAVTSQDKLVSFLYILMRDRVSPGAVEHIVVHHTLQEDEEADTFVFTNGWLAEYAKDVAARLKT